jgi:transposase
LVVAPALIPRRSGERIKTNRRDAVTLARLQRAGELTGVWASDAAHEAVRDLVRAREAAADDLRRKRQQLLSFLLRHSPIYSGGGHWTLAHRRWLAGQKFEHRLSFRKGSTRSTMPFNDCAVSRSSSPSLCPSGPWRPSSRPTRRCAALRFSSP